MTPIERLLLHREYVRRLARRLVGDPHVADDVAQQTFLIAMRGGPRSEDAARSWFTKIVRSVVINRRAAEAARKARELAHDSSRTASAPHVDLAQAETRAALRKALEGLEPMYSEVLRLRFYEGLTPQQIAERSGVGVETVRTRQRRGLQRLKDALERRRVWGWSLWFLWLRRRARPLTLSAVLLVSSAFVVVWLTSALWREPRGLPGIAARVVGATPDSATRGDRSARRDEVVGERRALDVPSAPSTSEVELEPPSPTSDGLALSVTVTKPDGSPADGATVWARSPAQSVAVRVAECGADGRARLSDVLPGSWIAASLEPFRESLLWRLDAPQFGLNNKKRARLDLGEALPPLTIRIVDAGGRPMPEASVRIVPDRRPQPVDIDRYVEHRERRIAPGEHDGVVQALGLRPYMWVIHASAPGCADVCVRRLLRVGVAPTEAVLTLQPGRTLTGHARFFDGRPAAGALVRIDPGFPFEARTAHADEFGRYELGQLPEAALALEAFAMFEGAGYAAREKGKTDVEVWDVVLERGGLLTGEASWDDGAPLADAAVHLLHGGEQRVVKADESGRFAFEACPPPPFDIAVSRPESGSEYLAVASVVDDETPLGVIVPRAPARLVGTLLVDEREKLRPTTLWLRALDWDEDRAMAVEQPTGRFDIVAAPGRFELLVWESGYGERFTLARVDLFAGRTTDCELVFEARGSLEVAGREPELRRGRLVLTDADGGIAAWKAVGSSGGDVLATFVVPQGRYGLRFESHQMIEELEGLCVAAGGVERVELTVGARRHVLGELRLPDRIDVGGARPWIAIDTADGRRRFVSNFDPREVIDFDALLEDGAYVLTARFAERVVRREFVVDGPGTFLSVSLDD